MKWLHKLKQLFTWQELTKEEYTHWVNIGRPTIMFYSGNDRRIAERNRGTIDWDEPYERRHSHYTYKK